MVKAIKILNELIDSTVHTVTIDNVIDNGDNTFKLLTTFTYYLKINSPITIDSVDYKVVSFVMNESLTLKPLKGTTPVTATDFVIPPPTFIHGTPTAANNEYIKTKDNPFIWVLEFLEADYDDKRDSTVKAIFDFDIFFLTDVPAGDWLVTDHYENAIYPMNNEIDFVLSIIKSRIDLFGDIDGHKVINHVNFGKYVINKGYDKKIIDANLSGSQLKIRLPYVISDCECGCPVLNPITCVPAIVKNTDLTYLTTVESGGYLELPDIINIDSDGTPTPTPAQTPFICSQVTGAPVTSTFNGASISSTPSGGNKDIVVKDTNGVNKGVKVTDTATDLIIEVDKVTPPLNTSSLMVTGATTSYQTNDDGSKRFGRAVDFFTLEHNNGFANTDRFTDDLGTQLYVSGVVVDWSTWNQVNSSVLCYYKTPEANANLTTHINNQPFTKNLLSNWWICNTKEINNIMNYGYRRDYLNYPPFNHPLVLSTDRIWTSTRDASTVGIFISNTAIIVGSHTASYKAFVCRTYTLTELGL